MFIDTHAHVNFNSFKDDADNVIRASLSEKTWMILVGSNYKTSKRALDFANKYERGVYAAVGLHPIHLVPMNVADDEGNLQTEGEKFNYDIYEKLAKFEKAVAIGEIGLDYCYIDKRRDIQEIKKIQKEAFVNQLILARRLNLPVIVHCRQAHDDMIAILSEVKKEYRELFPKDRSWGVMHCFSGNEDLAWQYFGLGLIISFTGLITFSRQWDELIRRIPNEKFMVETDCPYMTPEPFRGKRNEPIYVKYVAQRIAEIKNLTTDRVEEITADNAKRLFNI